MPCRKGQKARQAQRKLERGLLHPTMFPKRSMLEKWKLMNSQGREWNHLCLKITKTTSKAKSTTHRTHFELGTHIYSYASSNGFQMQKLRWTRNGQSSRQLQLGSWTRLRAMKGGYSGSTETQKESALCYLGEHVSSQKMRS